MTVIKVSIIIPIYNVEKYIELSLQSICNQSFLDYEIIIVNDGTMDYSMKTVQSVLRQTKVPFKIITQRNSGIAVARNTGLKIANGKYVCFIDSDDIVEKNFISTQYYFMENNDLDTCFCDFEETTESNRYGSSTLSYPQKIIETKQFLTGFMTKKYKVHCCTLLMRKSFLEDNDLFFNKELRFGEDTEFMWRVLPRLSRIGYIKAPLYKYLIREKSLMRQQSIEKIIALNEIYSQVIFNMLKVCPKYEEILVLMPARTMFGCVHSFAKQAHNYLEFKSMIKTINFKQYSKQLYEFPDIKINILAFIIYNIPKLSYKIFKTIV